MLIRIAAIAPARPARRAPAPAQTYPSQTITIVVPAAPAASAT